MTLKTRILEAADPSQVEGLSRFFKTGKGQYGEGDLFLGIKVPVTRSIVKECWKECSLEDLEECITSEYHELRLAALLSLVEIFKHNKNMREQCISFYLTHTDYINNWDLVDLSCYPLLGEWLLDKDRGILFDLAKNGATIWERRIGMVSTLAFIRHGQIEDSLCIAGIFLNDGKKLHDLLQKAVGWMLREVGKRDSAQLESWLNRHSGEMPRTMLRYAIEKFPENKRQEYMKK